MYATVSTNLIRYYFRNISFQHSKMATEKVIESSIINKLQENLKPTFLKVLNESYMHNVPKGAETHFKVVVVSEEFKDLPLIKRHRKVNELLKEELNGGVHALSIVAKTPDQWKDEEIEPSPNCRGGFGK
ncbi:bolA-like protein DDB_G0274169 isoform X1 [Anthonomus grandis grandis]|uniref:bolA-like protein DDB_G0274169 isoform X1 n=1 Tax=Anthonomus grandis grandis TaxID=2921223 RepID=UPI00216631D1|nr:bolA-like protein DDB_G0274169 isoform X1 [Anthonomus grandis grandis]